MTFDTVPWIIDGTTVDGEVIRRALGTLLGPASGIVTPGDLTVAQQATPNMSVSVGVGEAWVLGGNSNQGFYYGRNGAPVTLPIAASNPSNPRIDQIIVQVLDPVYAGGTTRSLGLPPPLTGTPTSGASLANLVGLATVPASSLVIAYVYVAAAATSILTSEIGNVAQLIATNAGPWTTLTLGSGITGSTQARRVGNTMQFQGAFATAGSVAADSTLLTVPAWMSPPTSKLLNTGLFIAGAGTITPLVIGISGDAINIINLTAISAAGYVLVDGLSYPLV